MSKLKRCLAVSILALLVSSVMPVAIAYADVSDFTVTDLSVDYYLSKDDPQGQMRAVERFHVAFSDQHHGILRALPKSYKSLPLNIHINRVSSDSGAPAAYSISSDSNGNEVIKIGDPNQTVAGSQEYTIDYTMQNVVTFYGDHDELYWNVNGVYWDQPFDVVRATIHLPSDVRLSSGKPQCFTGGQGLQTADCAVATNSALVQVQTTKPLAPNQTLTFVVGLQKGYFQAATWLDMVHDYGLYIAEALVPFLLLAGGGYIWWLKRGRDAHGTGIIVPQYDAPDHLSPIEVGTLMNFKAGDRDFTATIIDLAIRKYVRIVESDTKSLLGKNKQYNLQILKTGLDGLNTWESALMAALIAKAGSSTEVMLSEPNSTLQTALPKMQKSLDASLTERGYFSASPYRSMAISLFALVVIGIIVAPQIGFISPFVSLGVTAGAIVFAVFYHFMPARTAKGVAAKEHILGLKLYLKVAEKDRIKMLQSPDAPYAAQSTAPTHTVDLFEKLLPYAIVLGVETEWAKKFENMYTSPPDWYAGNYSAFSAGYLVGSLQGGFSSAVSDSFGRASSSGGSGFGGGGFSGGGGGGGGGGGW